MRLLDLFCKAGGAAMGYHRAGFDEIVGIDIEPQKRYPFTFVQCDALEYVRDHWREFDAIHASPPCQAYSTIRALGKTAGENAPALVEPVRNLLNRTSLPWVIENVVGAPLRDALMLCGSQFGLGVRRHRLFESNVFLMSPGRCRHSKQVRPLAVYGDHPQGKGDKTYRINRAPDLAAGQTAMGIDWMEWRELTQAIPPVFTLHIGRQLLDHIRYKASERSI